MPNDDETVHNQIRARIREVLVGLTKEEQKLFSETIRVESQYLHVRKMPKTGRDDLLKAVKQVIQ